MTGTMRPLPPCGGGLGWGVREALANGLENSDGVAKHLVVPEAQHAEALRFHERGAASVFFSIIAMLAAVDFDDNFDSRHTKSAM
jgi:hypothetical protein